MTEAILETIPFFTPGSAAPGTIATSDINTTLTGVGTNFLTYLAGVNTSNYGIISLLDDDGILRHLLVVNVVSDTEATLSEIPFFIATAVSYKKITVQTPYFRSFNTHLHAMLVNPPFGNGTYYPSRLLSVNGKRSFNINEGFLLKSIYLRLPYQYTLGVGTVTVRFHYVGEDGYTALGSVLVLGEGGAVNIPIENVEIPLNVYVPPPSTGNTNSYYGIAVTIENSTYAYQRYDISEYMQYPCVSCIYAPESLNGHLLPVTVGARVQHTLSMVV